MAQDWIEREVVIDASRERVWAVLTGADHVARWLGDSAEIDLRAGGQATFGWKDRGVFEAVIERVEPPDAFAFRWARLPGIHPRQGTGTLVEFTATEVPAGTLLRVIETGFASLTSSGPEPGWTDELAELKEYAERAVPGGLA